MLEAVLCCLAGFLPLAATSHRFRQEIGPLRNNERLALRMVGGALLVGGIFCCGSPLAGEWSVRFLAAVSIAATILVLALSAMPDAIMAPFRWALAASRR